MILSGTVAIGLSLLAPFADPVPNVVIPVTWKLIRKDDKSQQLKFFDIDFPGTQGYRSIYNAYKS